MSTLSSFPKRALLYKIVGTIALVFVVSSMAVIAAKRCTQATASESQARQLNTDQAKVRLFVSSYFYKLHILHTFSLTSAFLIVLFSFIDLVPKRDDDIKYAFHFISIFVIFCISLSTMYASFIAYERPCLAPEGSRCCQVVPSASLLSAGDKKALTAIRAKDWSMIAVMVLDLSAGILQMLVALLYFRDVRNDAEACGYLYRVHNEGYIIR